MRALTICQPYAHLIMDGSKRVENRTWSTKHRGRLIIHAGKSRGWLVTRFTEEGLEVDCQSNVPVAQLIFGAVVGEVQLIDCLHIDDIDRGKHDAVYPWLRFHSHTSGPWCWVLGDVKRCDPVPWQGTQGLFDIDPTKLNQVAHFTSNIREDE